MAYIKEQKNKLKVSRWTVYHKVVIDNSAVYLHLGTFNTFQAADQECTAVNLSLKKDYNGSYLKSLLQRHVEEDVYGKLWGDIVSQYIQTLTSHRATTASHLRRVTAALCTVLKREQVQDPKTGFWSFPDCTLAELDKNYDEVFRVFDTDGIHHNTQCIRHNHVKAAINISFQNRPPELKLLSYIVNGVKRAHSFHNETWVDKHIFQQIYPHATKQLQRAMHIVVYTGLRFGTVELLEMEYSHFKIDDEFPEIKIRNAKRKPKNGKQKPKFRVVPLCEPLSKLVKQWHEEDIEAGLTPRFIIHKDDGKPMSGLGTQFDRAVESAGLSHLQIRPYSMRHVFCQTLLDAGIDRLAVAHMLGHENTDMIDEVYGKDTTIRRRAAIPVLNNLGI